MYVSCHTMLPLKPSPAKWPSANPNPICLTEERLIKPEVFPGNPSAHQCLDIGPLRIGCLLVWRDYDVSIKCCCDSYIMMYRSNVVVIHTSSQIQIIRY